MRRWIAGRPRADLLTCGFLSRLMQFPRAGVNLQCRADPGVAEDGLRIAGGNAQVLEQRADRMPDVVDLDEPDLVVVADAPEGADEVARFDGPPGASSEHESGFWPGRSHVDSVGGLPLGLELERLAGYIKEWQASSPRLGLDRCEEQFATDSL